MRWGKENVQRRADEEANWLELGPVVAERQFPLFKQDGTKLPITVRIGKPFEVAGEYRCPVQILGKGNGRVHAPFGEDPFVALQYAIDLVGQLLDDLMRRENLETRFRPGEPQRASWIWRFPPRDFES